VSSGTTAKISGDLTLNGVTKPVILDAKFSGAGNNPFNGKATIGFHATSVIKRSAFGINYAVPLISDDVTLDISVAFEKKS
jgi:polyisoprenoid-binding protein YceI